MQLLALDIGNSGVHLGLVEQGQVRWRAELPHVAQQPPLAMSLQELLREHQARPSQAAFCSVVPRLDRVVTAALQELGCPVLQVRGEAAVGLAPSYDDPRRLGADRLMAALAARRRAGGPVIVADAGTAITVDAVSAKGELLAGAIVAGPRTQLAALARDTAQLPDPERLEPAVPGRSTEQCLAAGAWWGAVGAIKEVAARLSLALGGPAPLYLTGGAGEWLRTGLPEAVWAPDLVLEGLWWAWDALRGTTGG